MTWDSGLRQCKIGKKLYGAVMNDVEACMMRLAPTMKTVR